MDGKESAVLRHHLSFFSIFLYIRESWLQGFLVVGAISFFLHNPRLFYKLCNP